MDKEAWVRKVAEELHERLGSRYHLELTTREKEDVIEIQKEGDVTGIVLNLACYEEASGHIGRITLKKRQKDWRRSTAADGTIFRVPLF